MPVGVAHNLPSKPPESMNAPMSTDLAHDITIQRDSPVASPPTRRPLPTPTIRPPPPPLEWQITHYMLKDGKPDQGQLSHLHHHPHLRTQPSQPPHTSLLHRALAPITRLSNSSSNHFYIVPESTSDISPPLIVFTDSTPVLSAIPSGTLTVDEQEIRALGVEMAFWIAISLAYLDYLRDRDVSSLPFLVQIMLCAVVLNVPRVFWPLPTIDRGLLSCFMYHQAPVWKM